MRELLKWSPVIPVIVIDDANRAVPLAQALLAGGITVLEITLRTPAALEAIHEISHNVPEVQVGAGTIIHPDQFAKAKAAGASFGVSPGLTPALAEGARAFGLPYLPGVATVSEAIRAQEEGFETVKFYPAESLGGTKTLAGIAAVLPDLRFCPTGGVNLQNMTDYLAIPSVVAVGGTWLVPNSLLTQQNYAAITELAQQTLALLPRG